MSGLSEWRWSAPYSGGLVKLQAWDGWDGDNLQEEEEEGEGRKEKEEEGEGRKADCD